MSCSAHDCRPLPAAQWNLSPIARRWICAVADNSEFAFSWIPLGRAVPPQLIKCSETALNRWR